MKKILFTLMVIFFPLSTMASISTPMKTALDKFVNIVEKQLSTKPSNYKKIMYNSLIKVLESAKKTKPEKIEIINYLENKFENKLEQLNTTNWNIWNTTYSLPNVDMKRINETRLKWHNEVRKRKWLQYFTWNNKLQQSWRKRALHFVDIWTRTHARKPWDWFYNWKSIKEWFANQWIYFQWDSFSENIAYEYTSCNKWDCTDAVLWVMKKCFDFFMKEESSNWAHYRAIVKSSFHELWMWIAKDWNKYYVVTHYWTKVK